MRSILSTLIKFALLPLLLACSGTAFASDAVWVFEDTSNQQTLVDVMHNPEWFVPTSDTSRGFSDSTFWLRVELENNSNKLLEQVIQFDSLRLPLVEEFANIGKSLRTRQNGYLVELDKRPVAHQVISFPFQIPAQSSITAFYKIKTPFKADFGYRVNTRSQGAERINRTLTVNALVVGALAMLLAYNLFLAVNLRSRIYVAYSLFLACSTLVAVLYFRLYELVGYVLDTVAIEARVGPVLYGAALWFLNMLFARHRTRLTARLSWLVYAILAVHLLLDPYLIILSYSLWAGPVIFAVWTYLIVNALRRGDPLAKIVLVGWLIYLGFSLTYVANLNGLLGPEFEHYVVFGNLIEGVVFSIALGYRLRLADDQIEISHHQLSQAQKIGQVGTWTFNPKTLTFTFNDYLKEKYRLAQSEIPFENFIQAFSAADQAKAQQYLQGTLAGESFEPWLHEHRVDVQLSYWIESTWQSQVDANGRVLSVVALDKDVTEKVLASQKLQTLLDRYKTIEENSKSYSFSFTPHDRKVLDVSHVAEIFEMDCTVEITTESLMSCMDEHNKQIIEAVIRSGTQQLYTYAITTPTGKAKYLQEYTIPTTGEDGQLKYLISGTDVTDRIVAENREKDLLRQKAISQQQQASNKMLSQKNEKLEQLAQALKQSKSQQDRIFAIIGHELRTPAAAIDMMLDNPQIDNAKLKETSKHLLNVLNDMRAVIHPEEAIKGEVISTSVYQVVSSAIQYQDRLIQEARLQLHFTADDLAKTTCAVNAQLLRQISLNLIKNCALHSGATDLWISIEGAADKAGEYTVRFEDNGKGIAPSHQATLFDAFVRGDTESDGTGLGLHLSQQFAREHLAGDLRYAERDGGGSVFMLSITLADAEQEIKTDQRPNDYLRAKRILIAEDNDMLRVMTEGVLQQQGALVDSAENGIEAFNLAQQNHYDLVITDIFMPEMDGYELTQALRDAGFSNLVIGVSAATVGDELEKLKAAGADAVLSKPLKLDQLLDICTRLEQSPTPHDHGSMIHDEPSPVFDYAALFQASHDNPTLIKGMFGIFLRQSLAMPQQIEQAIQAGDLVQAKAVAHSLNGSAKSLFAEGLSDACQTLEAALLGCDEACIGEAFQSLESKCQALRQAIEEKLQSL